MLHAHGLDSFVRDEFGQITRCAIRQVLHDVATDQRHQFQLAIGCRCKGE